MYVCMDGCMYIITTTIIIIIIIISIQSLGRFWQKPEPSQATGMALARCILGKFLGVVCTCFPLPLDVPTFAARCLHVPINASVPNSERWNCGREWSGNFAEMAPFFTPFRGHYSTVSARTQPFIISWEEHSCCPLRLQKSMHCAI
jgi:hypothetical protein